MSAVPLGVCISSAVQRGTRARRVLEKNAQKSTIPQFPCILQPSGNLGVDPAFLEGVRNATSSVPLASWGWRYRQTRLLSKARLMQSLGIFVNKDSQIIKNSSHGEVWFGSIKVPSDGVSTPATVEVAIKFMPIQTKERDAGAAMRSKVSNAAYVDPFLSWLGSQLVVRQESCAFAQLFGTFICEGSVNAVKDHATVPLVAMVSETLGGKLDAFVVSCLVPGAIRWRELVATVLQAMLALAQAHAMSFVHNDAHMGNFLVAKTCASAESGIYLNINGSVLKVPAEHRVVLMDFGRSTLSAIHCESTDYCTGTRHGHVSRRLKSTEVEERFPKWDLDNPGADVTHFFAMLLLCQESPRLLVTEAGLPSAPPMARALVRLMRRALSCGTGTDMFTLYDDCNAAEIYANANKNVNRVSCGKNLVHQLRERDSLCRGLLPIEVLADAELTAAFLVTEPIPPSEVIYLPVPRVI